MDLRNRESIRENNLRVLLNRFRRDNDRPVYELLNQPLHHGRAFEIHNFSKQTFEVNGVMRNFNDAVLERVMTLHQGKQIMSYERAKDTMQDALNSMLVEDQVRVRSGEKKHYSAALNQSVFDRSVQCVSDSENDKPALASIVSYLMSKDSVYIKTWLITFLDELNNAYGQDKQSCVKGVRERAITSLRNIPDTSDFRDLFSQAEAKQTLKVKEAALKDMALWGGRLHRIGVKSSSTLETAKEKYAEVLDDHFKGEWNSEDSAQIKITIDTMMNLFDDMWDSRLLPELLKIESGQMDVSGVAPDAGSL